MASHEQIFAQETEIVYESVVTSNDLILENICRFMSFKDLLSSALINRRWNHFSRAELRKRRKCYAKISLEKPCHQLLQLSELFESKVNLPFSGLSIAGYCYSDEDESTCLGESSSPEAIRILEKFPIKHLKIMLDGAVATSPCVAAWLIKSLAKDRGREIQELSIGDRHLYWYFSSPEIDNMAELFGVKNTDWLPNVKTLEFLCKQDQFAHQFAAAAPKLQRIQGDIRSEHLHELLSMKKAHLIEDFILDAVSADNAEALMQFAELESKTLEQRNPGMLSKLQLVPFNPPLTHLRSLKYLKIEIFHNYVCPAVGHQEKGCLTAVSGYLAFARMPGLRVEIFRKECTSSTESSCCFGCTDLINFANVS